MPIASHPELLDTGELRDFARQRAEAVVVEPELLAPDEEQLGRQLNQAHVLKLRKVSESGSRNKRRYHKGNFVASFELFLHDAARRLAVKSQFQFIH